MPFDNANWPPTTSVRNSGSDLVGRRRYSTTHTTAAKSTTPLVPPNWLKARRTSVEVGGSCSAPNRAKRMSHDARPKWVRIIGEA